MKKILIITGIFPPEIGGPANYSHKLALCLIEKGFSVTVLTFANSNDKHIETSYEVLRVFRSNKLSNLFRFFTKLLSISTKFDVVYSLDWFSAGLPLCIASVLTGKKYILRIGGGYIWEKYLAEGRPPLPLIDFYQKGIHKQYPLMYLVIYCVFARSSHIVFNSRIQKDLYAKFYSLREKKISVIQNPVPFVEIKTRIQLPKKEIVFAGRFIFMKNIDSLIRAFAQLHDKEFTLRIIGDGPMESELKKLVLRLSLENRISFSPAMLFKDLYASIKDCYCVVIPSWTDISPNQVYECMSEGIPVLLTKENYLDTGLPPEFLVDPNSIDDMTVKMNSILDPETYTHLIQSCQAITLPKSWSEVVEKHITLFNGVYKQ